MPQQQVIQFPTTPDLFGTFFSILKTFDWLLYIILAIALFVILKDVWLSYIQQKYRKSMGFDIMEIRIPKMIEKGPQAMEQFFTSLHGLRGGARDKREAFMSGEIFNWFSFEVVAKGGKISLFMRVPKKLSAVVESMLYAQYPDIEIIHSEDYIDSLPPTYDKLESIGFNLFGTEFVLDKNPAYPLLTYKDFESREGTERIVDPIAVLLEVLGKLGPDETTWVQFVVRPAGSEWIKASGSDIKELKEKGFSQLETGETDQPVVLKGGLSPGERENLKLMEAKVQKPGFETVIRYIYFAPKDSFKPNLSSMNGYFAQFTKGGMNKLRIFGDTFTAADWRHWPFLFPKKRAKKRRESLYRRYRARYLPPETLLAKVSAPGTFKLNLGVKASILNSEELATIFHPPTDAVLTVQTLERVESKKVTPPSFLPY